jgi:hypothetical protein
MIRRCLAWLALWRRARANLATRKAALRSRAKSKIPHAERLALSGAVTVTR